ncbi:hypothetical protein MBOL_06800 [Mycobacteroides abscessus subsp. bolletii BD]|nr:hypothetical protein MBOL_06800 [Mycobacteroides abscessus subsp. bolletii BD]BBB40156.1 hypothetical protein MASB_07220 [Mycobacteroides abscessus subsp. bolletii BD]
MLGDNEPFAAQLLHGLSNGHASHAEMFNQFSFRRKTLAVAELTRFDCGPEHVRNLAIGGTVVRAVYLAKLQHQFSLPLACLDD